VNTGAVAGLVSRFEVLAHRLHEGPRSVEGFRAGAMVMRFIGDEKRFS